MSIKHGDNLQPIGLFINRLYTRLHRPPTPTVRSLEMEENHAGEEMSDKYTLENIAEILADLDNHAHYPSISAEVIRQLLTDHETMRKALVFCSSALKHCSNQTTQDAYNAAQKALGEVTK